MDFSFSQKFDKAKGWNACIIPYFQGKNEPVAAVDDSLIPSSVDSLLDSGDFTAKEGESLVQITSKKEGFERLILLGLGKKESCTQEGLRKAFAAVYKVLKKKKKCEKIGIVFPKVDGLEKRDILEAITEGFLFASYGFDQLKSQNKKEESSEIKQVSFLGISDKDSEAISFCKKVHEGLFLARDLVNSNADDVTPQKLAKEALKLGKEHASLKVKVMNKAELEKNKMGLILAVGRASMHDPAVILMEYKGNPKSSEYSAVVGKGITYDTGGLNLKPTGSMETMKCDMAGAATVLGLMKAIALLKLPVNVIGAIGTTENSIGPTSYKPGDVYRSYSGKMVEISNTDAEGRLVLADVISYLQDHYKLSRIIDLATLTGAVLICLGEEATGLFSNDDKLASLLIKSGDKTFERLWRLPIFSEFRESLKSAIADIKNSGNRKAGSSTAAIFIKEFIKDGLPWAHLDIAGTAYLSDARGYHNTPATGIGIRLLTDFFKNLKS